MQLGARRVGDVGGAGATAEGAERTPRELSLTHTHTHRIECHLARPFLFLVVSYSRFFGCSRPFFPSVLPTPSSACHFFSLVFPSLSYLVVPPLFSPMSRAVSRSSVPRSRAFRSICVSSSSRVAMRASSPSAPQPESLDSLLNPLVSSLSPSLTVAAADRARRLKESGVDVIPLAAGEPDFPTPPLVARAGIRAIEEGDTRYGPNAGTSALRAAIASKLRSENGLEWVAAENVIVSNGAKQSVWQALLATCGPGDDVIVPAPYWTSYPEMVRLAGARPVVFRGGDVSNGFKVTPGQLSELLESHPRARALILCSPNNPTGSVYSEGELLALAEVVSRFPRLLVVSDEIYELIRYTGTRPVSFASLPGMAPRTLTVNGFSKAFAMTGWRLGYLAAPLTYAKAANAVQSQTASGPSTVAQRAGLAALTELGPFGGDAVESMVRAFARRRDVLGDALRNVQGVRLTTPDGAFYLFPDVSSLVGPGAEGLLDDGSWMAVPDATHLVDYLLQAARVAAVPGAAFGAPECVRFSYAASDDDIAQAAARIARALDPERYVRPGEKKKKKNEEKNEQ